jgi:hypothetical protein
VRLAKPRQHPGQKSFPLFLGIKRAHLANGSGQKKLDKELSIVYSKNHLSIEDGVRKKQFS